MALRLGWGVRPGDWPCTAGRVGLTDPPLLTPCCPAVPLCRRKFSRKGLPLMLALFLGSKASVVTYRTDQSIAMKEQYYHFRDRRYGLLLGRYEHTAKCEPIIALHDGAVLQHYNVTRDRSALIMLVWPGLLAFGMARAEALRDSGKVLVAAGPSFAPGLMTGECDDGRRWTVQQQLVYIHMHA